MRKLGIPACLLLLAISYGVAQGKAAVERTAAVAQRGAATEDTAQTSPLEQLEWMVGEWIDEGEDATIITECSWTKNRKFLKRSFKVKTGEEVTLQGDQFVGWDPIAGQIRSWTFDSEGGFGEGRWIRDGNRWLVKTSFVLANGDRASALNVYTYVDPNTIRWQSIDREIAGELQPSIPEVTVVRQKAEEDQSQPAEKEVSQ